jgi:hypothetical protein
VLKIFKNQRCIFILQRRRLEFPVIFYPIGGGAIGTFERQRRRRRRRRLSRAAHTSIYIVKN